MSFLKMYLLWYSYIEKRFSSRHCWALQMAPWLGTTAPWQRTGHAIARWPKTWHSKLFFTRPLLIFFPAQEESEGARNWSITTFRQNIFSYLGFFQFGPRRVCSNRVTCQAKHVFDAIPQLAIYRHKTYECVHSPRTRTETARKWSWRRLSWKRKVWSCRYATAARAWWCILCRAGEVATGKEAPRMNRILDLSQKNVMRLKTWSKRWMPCQLTATFFSSLVNSNQITAEHCDECEMSARDAGLCLEKITISVVYLE